MKRIYPILTIIAAAGYITSLILYGLTFEEVNAQASPIFWLLTYVLFGIWFAAVLKMSTDPELKEIQRKKQFNPIPMLKMIFKGTPVWLLIIAGVSLVFAIISFTTIMLTQKGVVSIIDGEHVIQNHGNIIKKLSEEEYRHALAVQSRVFIGHYLAFFGVATAILFQEKHREGNH